MSTDVAVGDRVVLVHRDGLLDFARAVDDVPDVGTTGTVTECHGAQLCTVRWDAHQDKAPVLVRRDRIARLPSDNARKVGG